MPASKSDQWNRGIFLALRSLMHLIGTVSFWYAIYFDFAFVYPPKDHVAYNHVVGFGGKLRYLTVIGAICQASYFTLCVANDFIGTNEIGPKRPSKLRQFKDFFFATFAFPLAMNVGISFWALMFIDRELVLPKSFDVFFPSWLNHVMHTNIMIFILLETFISFRKYPSRKKGATALLIFNIAYVIWVHIIKYMSGRWVYPVLEVLNLPQRIGFILFIGVFGMAFYFVGESLNSFVWSSELKKLKSSGKKHK